MAKLHTHPIARGDKVYDLIRGHGEVIAADQNITVSFGGTQVIFSENGVPKKNVGRATLYWHDPVLANPPKNIELWNRQKAVLISVQALISE
jgi:oxalate decarboxylase/phosphoglucose isomerase-like protein (cupin superfamily)